MFDDEFLDLPDDDELAFLTLCQKYDRDLNKNMTGGVDFDERVYAANQYMSRIVAAAEALGIDFGAGWSIVPDDGTLVYLDGFLHKLRLVLTRIQVHHARRQRNYSVSLSTPAKAKIHRYIAKIRQAIEDSDLEGRKKDVLLKKLAVLAQEVDLSRTQFDRAMLYMSDFTHALAKSGKDISPFGNWVVKILDALGGAKDENAALPAPAEPKRIEGPKTPETPEGVDDFDGEISF